MSKSMRRALATNPVRINSGIPEITDRTELVSPQDAEEMLKRNKNNRPINWKKVEEFSETMRRGEWQLHPQGIILDPEGNILTGQTRLWAIVYSGTPVYLRISRGSPAETAFVIDRGRPQSARDLAARKTSRKHSPTEASISRAICILRGQSRPSTDEIFAVMTEKNDLLKHVTKECSGTKKDKSVLMILAAIVEQQKGSLVSRVRVLADKLERELLPYSANACWGRGASFGMAMKKAAEVVGSTL